MAKTDKKIRIFSALEVANICGVVNQTAINWIKNGYLKAFTTPGGQYRVYSDDLVEFLHSRGMRLPAELKKVLEQQLEVNSALIVDDDSELNNSIKDFLANKYPEFALTQAFDGFEAGKLLATSKPDVVVLNVDLPGIDGVKLCHDIKSEQNIASPIVVAVTSHDNSDLQARLDEAGADAYLRKPFGLDELGNRIEELARMRVGAA
jgi:two-component system, OmpR family, response regulator